MEPGEVIADLSANTLSAEEIRSFSAAWIVWSLSP
jgi:hypothetical protein